MKVLLSCFQVLKFPTASRRASAVNTFIEQARVDVQHAKATVSMSSRRRRYRQALRHDEPHKFDSVKRKIRKCKRKTVCEQIRCETESDDEVNNISIQESDGVTVCDNLNFVELKGDQHDLQTVESQEIHNEFHCSLSRGYSSSSRSSEESDAATDAEYGIESCESDNISYSEESSTDLDDDLNETDGNDFSKSDPPLYQGSPITLSSSILLTLSFVLKHKLTGEAFGDLLAVLEAHCPKPNNCRTSVKRLFDYFKEIKGNIIKHLFCSYCKAYIGKEAEVSVGPTCNCHVCGTELLGNTSFFIEAPIDEQIRKLFRGMYYYFVCIRAVEY